MYLIFLTWGEQNTTIKTVTTLWLTHRALIDVINVN